MMEDIVDVFIPLELIRSGRIQYVGPFVFCPGCVWSEVPPRFFYPF